MVNPQKINGLTYAIIGACMEVHREIGPGFPEEYYQKALELELPEKNISFIPQRPIPMMYKGTQIGLNYLDFDIEETVILEIKSVNKLTDIHLFQVLKYIAVSRRLIALLVNFGNAKLMHKRILPTKKIQEYWKQYPENPNKPL